MRKLYFPNLDGLRTIAFLFVFFIHCFYTENSEVQNSNIYQGVTRFFSNGMLGVNLFFVLSGFLITYLILAEEEHFGSINIKNFWLRRILRIWPLYFACVAFGFIIEPEIMKILGKVPAETADPILFLTFLANFNLMINGGAEAQNLNILWSVAIEEQFYFVWPILLVVFKRVRLGAFISLILLSIVYRTINVSDPYLGIHTLGVISDLAIGGVIAYLSFFSLSFISFFEKLKGWQILMVYIVGISLIVYRYDLRENELFVVFGGIIYAVFFAFIILEQNYSTNSFFKLSNSKSLTSSGKYTYGLYCLHMIAITASKEISLKSGFNNSLVGVLLLQTLLSLTLSMLLAYLSYEYFEKYFLGLKEKFGSLQHVIIQKDRYKIFSESYNWELLNKSKSEKIYFQSFKFDKPVMNAVLNQFNYLDILPNDTIWGYLKDKKYFIAKAPGIFSLARKKDKIEARAN